MKVCCVSDEAEMRLAVAAGASVIGLVGAMPSGPGIIDESRIAAIARRAPDGLESFLLTSATEPEAIVAQHRRCGTTGIQLCAETTPAARRAVRKALGPDVRLVAVVHVEGREAVEAARGAAKEADAVLLDSGRPGADRPELGGTGRVHDWEVSRAICEALEVPVFLAGGLTPANVGRAIRAVQPHAVDVCSGLRTAGRLDGDKLTRFMRAVRDAG